MTFLESSILNRLEQSSDSINVYDRFRMAVLSYLQLLSDKVLGPLGKGSVHGLKSYVSQHREAGWHTPLFILVEYTYYLNSISDTSQNDAAIKKARDAAAESIVYALVS